MVSSPLIPSRRSLLIRAIIRHLGGLIGYGVLILAGLVVVFTSLWHREWLGLLPGSIFVGIPGLILWKAVIPGIRDSSLQSLVPFEGIPCSAEIVRIGFCKPGDEARYLGVTCRYEHQGQSYTASTAISDWSSFRNLIVGEEVPILVLPEQPAFMEIRISELQPRESTEPRKILTKPKVLEDEEEKYVEPAEISCRESGDEVPTSNTTGAILWRSSWKAILPISFLGASYAMVALGYSQGDCFCLLAGPIFFGGGIFLAVKVWSSVRSDLRSQKTLNEGLHSMATIQSITTFMDGPEDMDYNDPDIPLNARLVCTFPLSGKVHTTTFVLAEYESYGPLKEGDEIAIQILPGDPESATVLLDRLPARKN